MAEPSITAVVAVPAALGITTAALLPGVDLNAVIGAFAGALIFVIWAKDLAALARAGFMIGSWIFGYFVASEVVMQKWTATSGLAGFFGALFCVVVCVSLLEWVQGGKTPGWLTFILRLWPRGGNNG